MGYIGQNALDHLEITIVVGESVMTKQSQPGAGISKDRSLAEAFLYSRDTLALCSFMNTLESEAQQDIETLR